MHALPQLFWHPAWEPSAADTSPGVHTPLGEVGIRATVDEHPLLFEAAAAYRTAAGARLWVWNAGVFRAELLRCRPDYRLPQGMTIRGCEAGMWRLQAAHRPAECTVSARWVPSAERESGSPESGEGLESQVWVDQGQRVSLGTPDLGEAVHYLSNGFSVSAPLATGAAFQSHFVVAWSADAPGDVATWFAVDCTPEQVLAAISSPAS
jgi:hypothetical protein